MHAEQFINGFPPPTIDAPHRSYELDQHPSEQWSDTFSDLLSKHLKGADTLQYLEDFVAIAEDYKPWIRDHAWPRIIELQDRLFDFTQDDTADSNKKAEYAELDSLTFHRLNANMIGLWTMLDSEHMRPSPKDITDIQTGLAADGVILAHKRARAVGQKLFFSPANQSRRAALSGIQTEIDVAITMLELTKSNPELIPLPGPSLFEHNTHTTSRNSDFIVFNTSTRQVRGIQAKTTSSPGIRQHYDSDFTTIIDGANDLGNTTRLNTHYPNQHGLYRSSTTVSWPGLIALEHIDRLPIKQMPTGYNKQRFLEQKFMARRLRKPDMLQKAAASVLYLVERDLTKQPSAETPAP